MELEGRNAIVSGGSLGIGSTICLELARAGANVALNYRKHGKEAEAIADEIRDMGRKALAYRADVTSFDDVKNMVEKAKEEFGKIDILVNNAGINWDGVIWKMSEEQWDEVINTNLKGYFCFTRLVSPMFREQKYGRIVNITSINGLRGKFGQANYSASKAGIIGFTKAISKELGKYGVTVNAVAPGMVLTQMMAALPEDIKEAAREESVLKRIGEPEDVAHLVVFLCSDKARHITGEVIKVDGGQYI